jgi:hypothetical protein
MAVPSSYFSRNYLSKDDYAEMWQKSLKVDYKPVCDVRIVKPKDLLTDTNGKPVDEKTSVYEGLKAAIVEVVKYTVKPSDMVQSTDWLLELVGQLHKTRAVSLGGIFKDYMKVDDDDLVTPTEREGNQGGLMFGWLGDVKRYRFSHFKNKEPEGVSTSVAYYSFFSFGKKYQKHPVRHLGVLTPLHQRDAIRELFDF